MTPSSITLLIHEPTVPARRAVHVKGLPFTLGSGPGANVSLRTPGIPAASIEAAPEIDRAFRLAEDGRVVREGEVLQLGSVSIRFLTGSPESVRQRAVPASKAICMPAHVPAPSASASASARLDYTFLSARKPGPEAAPIEKRVELHLERLAMIEKRLASPTLSPTDEGGRSLQPDSLTIPLARVAGWQTCCLPSRQPPADSPATAPAPGPLQSPM